MSVGILIISFRLKGCSSLKEKRSRLAPILHQVQRKFNVSISETDDLEAWRKATITCALVSNERFHIERSYQNIIKFIQSHWPEEEILSQALEII